MICVMEAGTCFIFCFHICYTHQWHCYWVVCSIVCTRRLSSGWETLVIWYQKKRAWFITYRLSYINNAMQYISGNEQKNLTCLSFFWLIFFVPHTYKNYIKALSDEQGPSDWVCYDYIYMYSIVTLGKSPHLRSLETSSFLKGKIQSFAECTLVLSLKYNIRNSLFQ